MSTGHKCSFKTALGVTSALGIRIKNNITTWN